MFRHPTYDSDKPRILNHAVRAGELVQVLFYAFLENTWAYDLSSIRIIRNQHGQLVRVEVTDGAGVTEGPQGQSTCDRYADGWLIRFPEDVSPVDCDAMRSLLADHNSTWAFVCMHTAVQALFEELVDDIEDIKELVHYPANHVRRIVNYKGQSDPTSKRNDRLYPDLDEWGDLKAVYDITLRDGTRIILDPASAQWRLQDLSMPNQPVMRWAEYWQVWGGTLKYRVPFRTHASRHAENMNAHPIVSHHALTTEQAFFFNVFILRLKKSYPDELQCVYDMDAENFNEFKAQVIGQAREYIQRRPRELDGEASPPSLGSLSGTQKSNTRKSGLIDLEEFELPLSSPLDNVGISGLDWGLLRRIIQSSSKNITYREKKRARTLLSYRCAYKIPGDWRLVFLHYILPDLRVPKSCVSENPFWH